MRTSAEEGRYRSTQGKEVKAVAFLAYAVLQAVVLSIKAILGWAVPF